MQSDNHISEAKEKHGKLVEDVASLSRVRNRLANSPDNNLPKILVALLPKLFARLEEYLRRSIYYSSDGRSSSLQSQAMEHLFGVLSHSVERLKGNPSIPITEILSTILPYVNSSSAVPSVWALTFLSIGVQRQSPKDVLPDCTMASLIRCVDDLYGKATQKTPEIFPSRLFNASWMLFDCFMLQANFAPLLDWDMDYIPSDLHWENQMSDSCGVNEDAVKTTSENGLGVFHLLLDLLLLSTSPHERHFMPVSKFGLVRVLHRNNANDDQKDKQHQNWKQPQRLIQFSENVKTYIRHLKFVCLRSTIWPMDQGLFQGINRDRALILSVVSASDQSMHGRLGMDFLKKASQDCSLAVFCSLFILIIGDNKALPILKDFQTRHPTAEQKWVPLLGELAEDELLQRPPLPMYVMEGVISYLVNHKLKHEEINGKSAKDHIKLLVDLTLTLIDDDQASNVNKQEDQKRKKFWCIQLMKSFYKQLLSLSVINPENPDDWAMMLFETFLRTSIEVLSVVVSVGESNVEKLINHQDGGRPLGVPSPFGRRSDLNTLLNSHRETQKRRKLAMEDAIEARQAAYDIISKLAVFSLNSSSKPFELPILLLGCTVYEEEFLQHYVTDALDNVLKEYIKILKNRKNGEISLFGQKYSSLQQLAIPLLPSLLDATCADSENARVAATKWINDVLQKMDDQAATFLLSFFSKESSDGKALQQENSMMTPDRFVDITEASGLECIKDEIDSRIKTLVSSFDISEEAALNALVDFDFNPEECYPSCQNDLRALLDGAGFTLENETSCQLNSDITNCGICYDVMEEKDALALHCGHAFCQECWQSFLEAASDEAPLRFMKLSCPQHDCKARITVNHVQKLGNEKVLFKWNRSLVEAFIELDPSYRFCPGVDCRFVAISSGSIGKPHTSTCDHCSTTFCFQCCTPPHQPASCTDVAEWQRLVGTSSFWIQKNSKPCPGCNAPIEKNNGCNHMTCRNCTIEFCWMCLKRLRVHLEPHICTRPSLDSEDDSEVRAVFLADRYQAQEQSELFARDQHRNFPENPAIWFLTEEHCETLRNALRTLIEARNFLKNSYISSFGLRKNTAVLSEHESHQGALEMLTEKLSQLTEMNLQRLYSEKGEICVINHFQRAAFYQVSVTNYMHRIQNLNLGESSIPEECL